MEAEDGEWIEVSSKKKMPDKNQGKKLNNERRTGKGNPSKNGKNQNQMKTGKQSLSPQQKGEKIAAEEASNIPPPTESAESSHVTEHVSVPPPAPLTTEPRVESFLDNLQFCKLCFESIISNTEENVIITKGLSNTRSECFRNCVLQALFALDSFQR
jgi:hypothetical protein